MLFTEQSRSLLTKDNLNSWERTSAHTSIFPHNFHVYVYGNLYAYDIFAGFKKSTKIFTCAAALTHKSKGP